MDQPLGSCCQNDTIVQTKGFCTDVFFQAALGWIKKQHEAGKPYFAYISPNAPHGPMIAPEKYKKRWLDAGWDQNRAGRYGMIENIDDNIGLQRLDGVLPCLCMRIAPGNRRQCRYSHSIIVGRDAG
jgi:arylsulfatase A-like enzyme